MGTRNLVLVGFMGTGKTTIGRLCAERLGFQFRDSDAVIESRIGCSIAQYFTQKGEAAFRAIEREVIAELAEESDQVISTGGGVVLDPENTLRLRASGWVVLMQSTPEAILSQVGDTRSRPLLADAADPLLRIEELLAIRQKCYERAAHFTLLTQKRIPEALASQITERYQALRQNRMDTNCVPVLLGERSYSIHIKAGMLQSGNAAEIISEAAQGRRACLVTHPKLEPLYAAPLAAGLAKQGIATTTVLIPPGERTKNLNTVAKLYTEFACAGLDRKSLVIAVGGGVLGDLVGFAAATYLRGIRFVQVPTTLLAQVDASVGGKTGVDLPEGKNLVGAFHQPGAVLIDPLTLKTLPARELRAGLAEVIKYGIIYDKRLFRRIVKEMPFLLKCSEAEIGHIISRSCEIKAEIVMQDETEQGVRAILNFGHTIGHALEAVTNYRRYKHGEAVAIGMVSAALIGEEAGITQPVITQAICDALLTARLPYAFPADIDIDSILAAAQRDKKAEAGKIRFVLARHIADVCIQSDVPEKAIRAALNRQCQL